MHELIFRYRIAHYPGPGRDLDLRQSARSDVNQLLKYHSPLYKYVPQSVDCVHGGSLQLLTGFARPTLGQMAEHLRSNFESATSGSKPISDFELLASVLACGDTYNYYGSHYWARVDDTFHLLMCGINWDRYHGVHDTKWSQFDGTFAETTREKSVLGADLACSCSDEIEVSFGLEPPSLASLYAALGANALERLFEI